MQKIINNPRDAVDVMLSGFVNAHNNISFHPDNHRVLFRKDNFNSKRVGIMTGRGLGHEPAFIDFLTRGIADSVAVGAIYLPPSRSTYGMLGGE